MGRCKLTTLINKPKWTDRELLDVATGLQKYGASETSNIAKLIGTKSEQQVKSFIRGRIDCLKMKRKREKKIDVRNKNKTWKMLALEEKKNWPSIRKWSQIIKQEITPGKIDYSVATMRNMFEDFYEEAETITNPQLIDVKAIYKFLSDCMCGRNPAELMPKESGVILTLLKKLKEIKSTFNFDEEKNFIRSYKKATHFVPFPVKKEENKITEEVPKAVPEDDPDDVCIPQEVYSLLHLHHRLVRSMNPFMVPLWLLDKEQSYLFQAMQPTSEKC